MKIFRNRTVIGVLCILLALIICFGVTPLFSRSASEKTEIVRVTKDIKEGDEITAEMVQTVEVGAYNLPQNLKSGRLDVRDELGFLDEGSMTLCEFCEAHQLPYPAENMKFHIRPARPEEAGLLFVAAAIGNDKQNIERIYGDSFLDITDLNQLPTKLTGVVKRHIRV